MESPTTLEGEKVPENQPPPFFKDGENVLCFHGPVLYEGKILKTKFVEGEYFYFVHYSGWNKKWDEWVVEKRVLRLSDTNRKIQDTLKMYQDIILGTKKTSSKKSHKKRSIGSDTSSGNLSTSDSRSSTPINELKGGKGGVRLSLKNEVLESEFAKKQRKIEFVESEAQFETRYEIEIKIPDVLKKILIEDWTLVTQKKMIHREASITTPMILEKYLSSKQEVTEKDKHFCNVLQQYFNQMAPTQLLYRYENPQSATKEKDPDKKPSKSKKRKDQPLEIKQLDPEKGVGLIKKFGFVHLLRMLSKLGHYLVYTEMKENEIKNFKEHTEDLLKFLAEPKNCSEFFIPEAYTPVPEPEPIIEKAKTST